MNVKCAECLCAPQECSDKSASKCPNCTKEICCCITIHARQRKELLPSSLFQFLLHAKGMYAAALGLEILCITAAVIGENVGLYLFGVNALGIPVAYAMGYGLAAFVTFAAILGRYTYGSKHGIDACCSVLEQVGDKGFIPNLKATFRNFALGIEKMPHLYKQSNLKSILKTSLYILITAESACILVAETVDLILYQYSILVAVPLALLAGAFTIVTPAAYSKIKMQRQNVC